MRKKLKPGLLVTAAAMVACAGSKTDTDGRTHNPPPPPQRVSWTAPTGPWTAVTQVALRDGEGRAIRGGGANCWVELPFETPPTSVVAPPTMAVECPPPMVEDPIWAQCNGGSIHVQAVGPPLDCICYVFGNPPPPPVEVECPAIMAAVASP